MIQLNLLPDLKLQYIRARQKKRLVVGTSAIVSIFFVSIFVLLFIYVRFAQSEHLSDLEKDINSSSETLKSKKDFGKVLTIQNQLSSIPKLHDDKRTTSRLFDYLVELTPNDASISELSLDLEEKTILIKGGTSDLSVVNKFVDTLKFTDYKTSEQKPREGKAFSEVVLTKFNIEKPKPGEPPKISYEIKAKYDETIFSNNIKPVDNQPPIDLIVPSIISTRSSTEKPKELFVPSASEEEGGQ